MLKNSDNEVNQGLIHTVTSGHENFVCVSVIVCKNVFRRFACYSNSFFFFFLAAYFGKVFFKFLVIDYIFSFIVIFSFEKR